MMVEHSERMAEFGRSFAAYAQKPSGHENEIIPDELLEKLAGSVELFGGFSHEEIGKILAESRKVYKHQGDIVIQEGEQGGDVYIILSGGVEVRKRASGYQKVITELGPGQSFGEMALVDLGCRSASVRAAKDSCMIRVSEWTIVSSPQIAAKIYKNIARTLASRLRATNEMLALR